MTAEEVKSYLVHLLKTMTSDERAEVAAWLYVQDMTGRERARELLCIDEEEYIERVHGAWLAAVEERFESLPYNFLSAEYMKMTRNDGE